MYGSTVNGNIPGAIITGGRDPGSIPERAGHGNQDIGRKTKEVTNGIKAAGRDKDKDPKNRKAPL